MRRIRKHRKAPPPAPPRAGLLEARWVFSLDSAALAIPGIGPLLAAGPIVATLAGVGAGGAAGGIIGALVGMGIPEYEAKRYEGHVKNGGVLMSVHCDTSKEITRANEN